MKTLTPEFLAKTKLNLFNGHDPKGECGYNPLIVGINSARLGALKEELLNCFSTSAYSEDFFNNLNKGYDAASNEDFIKDLPKVDIPMIDIMFIMKNLRCNKLLKDFNFSEPTFVVKSRGAFDIVVTTICRHKKLNLLFEISYYFYIHKDGSYSRHWHVEAKVTHNLNTSLRYFRKGYKFTTDENDVWNEAHYHIGGNSTSFWYETAYPKKGKRKMPNSSSVAKLIKLLEENYNKTYFNRG